MTRTLPALHEGHAPYHLHQAFSEALDAFEDWLPGQPEPTVLVEGRNVPISAVFGRMRTCEDLVPSRVADVVFSIILVGSLPVSENLLTYAHVAAPLRAKCVDRFKRVAAAFTDGAEPAKLRRVLA